MSRLSKLSRSIKGKVALITGAASGMGLATAELFADEGAHVAVTDLDQATCDDVAARINEAGGSAYAWRLDVASPGDRSGVVQAIVEKWGRLDILVNNAGMFVAGGVDSDAFEAGWDKTVDILLRAPVMLIRECLPHLEKADDARIINIASTEGLGATYGISPYTAAKTGLIGLTRSLALEFGMRDITVNCICPGPINTGLTADISDEHKGVFAKRRVALKRYGDPEEVAHATLNFALPASRYITGTHLPVDGGLTIRNA
ncbi:MAG: SDR family oxidoreductase [Pseudomonadota bacterium]